MTIEISILVAVIGCVLSVATFFIGRTSAAQKSGQADGEMRTDVKYIKASVDKQEKKLDRVVENYEDIKLELETLKGRIKALEQKVEFLHGGDGI